MILVYVDDLLLFTANADQREPAKRQISDEFKIRDLGAVESDSWHAA